MGDMFQYIAQVVGSLGVAFYLSWKVTLVLLCAIPVIAAAGTFMIIAITDAQHKSHEQYAHAGGVATEAISSIRTVTAFNMQPIMINDYRKHLFEAMRIGITKGIKMGLGNGAIFCAVYLTYALGFWYGAELVANDREHCTHNCLTGGDIMAAFISVIFGAMALGQVLIYSRCTLYIRIFTVYFRPLLQLHHLPLLEPQLPRCLLCLIESPLLMD